MNESTSANQPLPISIEKASTIYSNMCRGVMTSEEVILDFALNPNLNGKVLDETLEVKTRVVMSFSSTKRLLHLLHAMVTKHEEAFGAIPLDVNERLATQKTAAAAPEANAR